MTPVTVQPRYLIGAATVVTLGALLLFRGPWTASAQGRGPQASNAMLSCEAQQQAVVRHTIVNNELQVAMQCVGAGAPVPAGYTAAGFVPAGFQPAAYRVPQPVYASDPVYVAPARATRVAARPVSAATGEPKRNWKKTALVIGGSAGAGAGVGAIAGGKKGALIGAAIGGGAASLFEALKKN